ncbi:hypothetical protein [Nocardioides luteus]|uniref:hypothetical protein n=1 Tax=Nocardioides luteus TaxID=1844 RepID=UPI00115F7E4A|nr:hypothetical protein [Nocardioides luteus]
MGDDAHRPGHMSLDPSALPPSPQGRAGKFGHGKEFGADIFALFRAGRVKFPDLAAKYSGLTGSVHDFTQQIAFLGDSVGGEAAFRVMENLRNELHFGMRRTTEVLDISGRTLVQVAELFVETDEEAKAKFDELREQNLGADDFAHPAKVPEPPGTGAPYGSVYEPPSLESPKDAPEWFEGMSITGTAKVD